MYKLFFDTDCDITPEIARRYDAGLISMPYVVEEEIYPFKDSDTFDYKAFYKMLRSGVLPTTCALSKAQYIEYFEPTLKEGKDILYVHFSRVMTVSIDVCEEAIKELLEKYPGRRIQLVDTKGITVGGYVCSLEVAKLYKAGKSIDEIVEWAKTGIDQMAFYFFADNIKFFKKSGRVTGFKAFMGGMMGVKPLIYIGENGKMTSIGSAMSRKKAIDKILEYVDELQVDIKKYPCVIAHSDADYLVDDVKAKLHEKYGEDLKIEVIYVNPTAGSHCGPDALGLAFHAKKRTADSINQK